MTARVKKEIRVLLPPWSVAMVAALLFPVVLTLTGGLHRRYIGGLPLEWLQTLAGISIFVGGLAMAAMSFGVEIQHRTIGLLLVQPMERSRLWWSKMLPLVGAYLSLGLAFIAGQFLANATWGSSARPGDYSDVVVFVVLLAGVMCSSAFWTLQSRSIIGGMVLPLAAMAMLAFAITYFMSGRTMEVPEELEPELNLALGVGAIAYCVLFAYLGWWKFSHLEWREGIVGESIVAALPVRRRVKESQSTAPSGPWASLLRKELRLHRPVIHLAALFVVCWIAALGLRALRPAWEVQFEGVLGAIIVIYLPLAWLLSGCISLGEEKQLGTWAWHLTLPVSRLRQWTVKVSFALLVVLTAGIVLPALAWLVANGSKIERPDNWLVNASPVLLVAVYATVLSFWAVTMLGTVVRAVLFTLLGAGVLFFGSLLALGVGEQTHAQQGLSAWLMIQFQFTPHYFSPGLLTALGAVVGLILLLGMMLRQSYVHCRRAPSRRIVIRSALALLISLFLPLWWGSDLRTSFWSLQVSAPVERLRAAAMQLPAVTRGDVSSEPMPVTVGQLAQTGMLDPETARWLRNTRIHIVRPVFANSTRSRPFIQVGVTFRNGQYFETAIEVR